MRAWSAGRLRAPRDSAAPSRILTSLLVATMFSMAWILSGPRRLPKNLAGGEVLEEADADRGGRGFVDGFDGQAVLGVAGIEHGEDVSGGHGDFGTAIVEGGEDATFGGGHIEDLIAAGSEASKQLGGGEGVTRGGFVGHFADTGVFAGAVDFEAQAVGQSGAAGHHRRVHQGIGCGAGDVGIIFALGQNDDRRRPGGGWCFARVRPCGGRRCRR